MATTLQCDISAAIRWQYGTDDGADVRQVLDINTISLIDSLTNGNGLDQANLILHGRGTATLAIPIAIDLAGTTKDVFGNTVTMTRVRAIAVTIPYVAGGGDITLGGTFLSYLGGTTPTVYLKNGGGIFLWNPTLAGYTVTAGTGDLLQMTATTAAATVDYVIVGSTSP